MPALHEVLSARGDLSWLLTHAGMTTKRAFLSSRVACLAVLYSRSGHMMRGMTNWVGRSRIISFVSLFISATAVGAFEPALPDSKPPAPKLDNGEVFFQSELVLYTVHANFLHSPGRPSP